MGTGMNNADVYCKILSVYNLNNCDPASQAFCHNNVYTQYGPTISSELILKLVQPVQNPGSDPVKLQTRPPVEIWARTTSAAPLITEVLMIQFIAKRNKSKIPN